MKKIILILLSFVAIITACNKNRIYEKHEALSGELQWVRNKKPAFNVDITDTTIKYDQSFALRYVGGYPYKDLQILVTRTSPSGKVVEKKYSIQVFDNKGNYKGEGLGDYWDYEQLVEKEISFPETGTYQYIVKQATSFDTIAFVMELGLFFDKAKPASSY